MHLHPSSRNTSRIASVCSRICIIGCFYFTGCGQKHTVRKTAKAFVDAVNSGNETKILSLLCNEDKQFVVEGSKRFRALSGTTSRAKPTDLIATSSSTPPLSLVSIEVVHMRAGPPETATIRFNADNNIKRPNASANEDATIALLKEEGRWKIHLNLRAKQLKNRL